MPRLSSRLWLAVAGGLGISFLVYGRSLPSAFVYDDLWTIVHNRALDQVRPVARFFLDRETVAHPPLGMGSTIYRPLPTLTFALDRAVGPGPARWRAENLALHGLNGVLVGRWFGLFGLSPVAAGIGALVFLVHPAQVETVAWVTQRSNLLSFLGMIGALLLFSSPRKRDWAAGLGFLVLGLLSKETAVLLPVLWLVQDHVLKGKRPAPSVSRHRVALTVSVFVAVAGFLILRREVVGPPFQRDYRGGGLGGSLLLGAVSWLEYLKTLLWPLTLRVSHRQYVENPWENPWPWVGLLAAALFSASVWILWRKKRPAAFLLGWIPATLLLVLGIFPTDTFMAERFLYVPLAGLGGCVAILWDRFGGASSLRVRGLGRGLMVAMVGLGAVMSFRATAVWKSELSLWTGAVRAEPENAFARLNQAAAFQAEGRPHEAEPAYKRALILGLTRPQAATAFINLSRIRLDAGDPAGALRWVEKGLRAAPDHPAALHNQVEALEGLGRKTEAALVRKKLAP